MFSGKTELIRNIINKYALGKANKLRCLHFKFNNDTRYTADERVLTHSGSELKNVTVKIIPPKDLTVQDVSEYDIICVDELHFCCDPADPMDEVTADMLERWVYKVVYKHEKILVTSTNDFWDSGKPIAPVMNLMKLAHETPHLYAQCDRCGDFNATMSKFRGHLTKDAIIPGGSEHWMALCYDCFKYMSQHYKDEYYRLHPESVLH